MAEQAPGVHLVKAGPGESLASVLERAAEHLGVPAVHARVAGTAAGLSVHALTPAGEHCVLQEATVGQVVQADAILDEDGFRCMGVVSVVLHGVPLTFAGRVDIMDALDITLLVQPVQTSLPAEARSASAGARVAEQSSRVSGREQPESAAPRPRPQPGTAPSPWARVAAVSNSVQEDDDSDDECDADDLVKGDILLHPKLGRCRVLMLTGVDAVKVQVPSGSPRKLMLRPFRIYRKGDTREFELRLKA